MDKFSFLNAVHPSFLAELYEKYLQYPDSVEPSWRAFFQGYDFGSENGPNEFSSPEQYTQGEGCEDIVKEFRVLNLIDGYRTRGHYFTKTNPVRERRKYSPTLDLENFGLSDGDLKQTFKAGEVIGLGEASLEKIIDKLKSMYCDSIGMEYMFIRQPEQLRWIQERLNSNSNQPSFEPEYKKHLLAKLNEAVSFETFLHTKFVGQKRFSLEGGESLIPALDTLIENAADVGVKEFVMGMAHRGRLSTLTGIFGKSAKDVFKEFEGKDYAQETFDGDVKYHLGWTSKVTTNSGKEINLNIAPNPSHLETVGAVVQGIARAKQDDHHKETPNAVLPIVVHGDAAISGQGIVYEIVQMAQLDGYKTQGTIHIVVNNQVGFTTNYLDGRSSIYCTDVGKVTFSPIFHVNADDVEAVVHVMKFALDFRMKFGRDVFIDLLGYRKYGHNEGDEPRFTQPKLYKAIAKHKNPRDLYAERLIKEGLIDENYAKDLEEKYKNKLEESLESSKKEENIAITPIMQDEWEGFERADRKVMMEAVDTTFDLKELDMLAEVTTTLPSDKHFLKKTTRLFDARKAMYFEKNQLDWAMGELLAYATLLKEGHDVRMSGQDVERGTFSHRHAVITVEDSEDEVILLNELEGDQGNFYIYNSLLSEYGVVGFDYGYAMASPKSLVIWEAQFGDFSNGAQIIIDQYISAAEDKWNLQNGLVMLLPHGYEGQGAEHSSARMERYLQMCANDNMFVADVTTPANLFHLLRRQLKTNYRKPLIVFTPKSLLRHPKVVSTKEDLANGSFQMIIDDTEVKASKVKSLVFVTGKFYYDLIEKREQLKRDDVAFVRIEQLFPLPVEGMREIMKKYSKAKDIVWAQEEPKNMGAYSFLMMHMEEARNFRVCSRKMYAAPAAGSAVRSKARHEKVMESVFDKDMK